MKAWGKYIEEKTSERVRALIVDPRTPEYHTVKRYWAVDFYEDQPTHVHRWQTFFVRLDGKEILVDDPITGDYMDLQKWREKEKPLERVREPSTRPTRAASAQVVVFSVKRFFPAFSPREPEDFFFS